MSLSKFAVAGVLAAGLGLANAAPADAQIIISGGPGYYVRPTPYVVPSYGYGYRSYYPSYGYGSRYGYPGYGGYRYGYPGYSGYRYGYPGYGGYRYGYPGYGYPRSGFSFGFTIVR